MTKLFFLISLVTLLFAILMLEGCAQLQTPEGQAIAATVVEKAMLRDFPYCLQKLTTPAAPAVVAPAANASH